MNGSPNKRRILLLPKYQIDKTSTLILTAERVTALNNVPRFNLCKLIESTVAKIQLLHRAQFHP